MLSYDYAQDPHFTQAFSAPTLVNPSYTGVFDNSKYRFSSIHRQQWTGLGVPFITSFVGFDAKLFDKNLYYQNPFNIGFNFLSDRTLKGALKNNNGSLNLSYHVPLTKEGKHTIGLGLGITYGSQHFDFSALSTSSQFTSGGFDLTLPNFENIIGNVRPYFLINPGILYTYNNREDGTFFDFGFAVYNSNQPYISLLFNEFNRIPRRMSAQATFQKYMNDNFLINAELQYQSQSQVDYLLTGFSIAKLLSEEFDPSMIGIGLWYRTSDIVAPYLYAEINKMKFSLTYDFQVNDIGKNLYPATTLEFSLGWRFGNK